MSDQDRIEAIHLRTEPVPLSAAPLGEIAAGKTPTPFHLTILHSAQYLARNHPALGLTLGYIFLTAVGMTYELLFFDSFNLQIFNFAEPSDFLLVAFREPLLLVFTLISMAVLVKVSHRRARSGRQSLLYRFLLPWLEKQPWWGIVQKLSYVIIVAGYFTSLTSMYANHTSKAIRAGAGTKIRVELISEPAGKAAGGNVYTLLGTTSRYLLLFDATNAQVLPINNIARLTTEK